MRLLIVKQGTDRSGFGQRLVGDTATKADTLQALQRLNPHVDFDRVAAGTVLLVPEGDGLVADESTSIAGQAFGAFRGQVAASLDGVGARIRAAHETRATERAEVSSLLKGAAVKRLVDADPDLKPQVDAIAAVYKRDQQDAKDADALIAALQAGGLAELDALAARLGG